MQRYINLPLEDLPDIPKGKREFTAPIYYDVLRCDGTIERLTRKDFCELQDWCVYEECIGTRAIHNEAGAFGSLSVMLCRHNDETAGYNKFINGIGDACLITVFDNTSGGRPPPDALHPVLCGTSDAHRRTLENQVCKSLILFKHVIDNPWTECLRIVMKLATRQAMTMLPIGQWVDFNAKMEKCFNEEFKHPHAQTFRLEDVELAFNEDFEHPHAQKFHLKSIPPTIGESVVVLRSKNALDSALGRMFHFMYDFRKAVTNTFVVEVKELVKKTEVKI